MPARHIHRLHHLAVAIALTLGYAGNSLAQQLELDFDQHLRQSPEQVISALDAFIKAPDTVTTTIRSGQKAKDGVSLQQTEANDLVIVKPRGSFAGVVDGGAGDNVLQLDAKEGKLGESRNFKGLEVKQGTWTRTGSGDFTSGVLIRAKASLVNEGNIHGGALTEGIFINRGRIGRDVTVLPGGDLMHSGLIAGNVDVQENGHFAGSGIVGGLNVQGRFSVDEVYGAPRIRGDLNLSRPAVLAYSVDASGNSPTIIIEGTASLGDATLKLVTSGDYPQSSQHTILEAGKVEGRFGTVENDLAYMTPTLDYDDPKRVGLTYARNDVPIEQVATSDNGRELGKSIKETQALPDPSPAQTQASRETPDSHAAREPQSRTSQPPERPLQTQTRQSPVTPPKPAASTIPRNAAVAALLTSDKVTAAVALDQLSGGSTANLANATLSSVTSVSASLLSAMHQLDNLHDNQPNAPRHAAGNAESGRVWLQALGHRGKLDRDMEPMQHSTKGLLLGADWRLDGDWRLGLMGGTSDTRIDSKELDGDLDSWHLGAYALRQTGPLSLRLGAAWSRHEGNTRREVAFGRFHDRLKGNYQASTQQAFIESGYNLGRANVSIEPFAGLGYQRYHRDGYTEKGGDAALKVHAQSQGNFNTTVGLRMAKVSTLDNGMRLTPRLSAGWKHVYGETYTSTRQRLATETEDFTVYGAKLDRDSLKLDTGLDLAVSNSHTLGVALSGEIGTDSRSHGISGQWRMAF
ncbi:autotransporter domain-containing protein [Pseudomonas glycinae]|uniref:autotransporter domain-containing protein n=1 Tax=Candidatus Pseudomonas auctus TaxID=3461260 RepID=UPI003B8FEA5A